MQAQRLLPLSLLYAAGGKIKGKTRFQKLAFLADQELEEHDIDPYDFIPYDYGPFDKSVFESLEFLEDKGLVKCDSTRTYGGDKRYDYRLTQKGHKSYKENLPEATTDLEEGEEEFRTIHEIAEDIVDEYNDVPISNLLDYVYTEYPEYAENSVLS